MFGNLFLEQMETFNFLKQIFFETNWMFLLYLAVVVVFIGGQRTFDTTITTVFYTVSVCLILFFSYISGNWLYKSFDALLNTFCGQVGVMLLLIAFIYLILGLKDEEKTKEYVHTPFYWIMTGVVSYISVFLICTGLQKV